MCLWVCPDFVSRLGLVQTPSWPLSRIIWRRRSFCSSESSMNRQQSNNCPPPHPTQSRHDKGINHNDKVHIVQQNTITWSQAVTVVIDSRWRLHTVSDCGQSKGHRLEVNVLAEQRTKVKGYCVTVVSLCMQRSWNPITKLFQSIDAATTTLTHRLLTEMGRTLCTTASACPRNQRILKPPH